jgi:hypothetical protein
VKPSVRAVRRGAAHSADKSNQLRPGGGEESAETFAQDAGPFFTRMALYFGPPAIGQGKPEIRPDILLDLLDFVRVHDLILFSISTAMQQM